MTQLFYSLRPHSTWLTICLVCRRRFPFRYQLKGQSPSTIDIQHMDARVVLINQLDWKWVSVRVDLYIIQSTFNLLYLNHKFRGGLGKEEEININCTRRQKKSRKKKCNLQRTKKSNFRFFSLRGWNVFNQKWSAHSFSVRYASTTSFIEKFGISWSLVSLTRVTGSKCPTLWNYFKLNNFRVREKR